MPRSALYSGGFQASGCATRTRLKVLRDIFPASPGMSLIAEANADVAGCLFGGHDRRRGYLNHLAVAQPIDGTG